MESAASFVLLLSIVLCAHGSGARDMTEKHWTESTNTNQVKKQVDDNHPSILRLHSMDVHIKHDNNVHDKQDNDAHRGIHTEHVHAYPSSNMDHMDPSLEKADDIPFSSRELTNILQLFSFSRGSPQAEVMEDSLRQCEFKPIEGEIKICATSLESMLDFVSSILGLKSQIKVLATTHLTSKSNTLVQNYTVLAAPKEISATNLVACHRLSYPYAVFHCHSTESKIRVFKVLLAGEDGAKVYAVAVCHTDTTQWSRNHVSFRMLGTEPGLPVCHFFQADHFVWISSPTS
ncbi:unnamed protein product [Ilex paraguariensis]|uniref:BURP domain-containing protein n=1 Tax=Ilex paraguariensis TaxID=185542 RepID=A0ABC8SG54_9AQUA